MNDHAKYWLQRLSDGSYRKTKHALHNECGFCCMGVGCNLYAEATGEGEWVSLGSFHGTAIEIFEFVIPETGPFHEEREPSILPDRVREWLGLVSPVGAWGRADQNGTLRVFNTLTTVNDEDENWDRVIKTIREEPKGLFLP